MRLPMRRFIDWIEHRTGLESAIRNFLFEDIPASSGWYQVFGSVPLFFFLVQVLTWILLAFNSAPTAGEAYNTQNYIIAERKEGSRTPQLPHWHRSMMTRFPVCHTAQ